MSVIASSLVAEISANGLTETQAAMEVMSATNDAVAASFAAVEEAAAAGGESLASVGADAGADESSLASLSDILSALQAGFSDLDASLSEVAANTADTAGGVSDLSGALSDMEVTASASATAIAEAGASASDAEGGFGGLLSSVSDAATGFGMFVFGAQATVNIAEQIGGALVNADASMEQTQVAFTTLTGSASAANDMISKLVNFAATTPFHEEGIEQAAEKMLAFGFNSKEVIPDITAIGDVLSGLGKASDASLSSIVDIFGKIQAAGKLTGGDMMQLTRWGIPAWQLLSKEMGVPIPVLQDMVKKGLVPAKTAIDDLRKGIEDSPLFKGGMAKQAQTFNGLMSTLQDNVKSAWREFTGPLFDQAKGALVQLGNLVSSKGFQQWAKDMGKDVGEGISAVVGFVQNDLIPAFNSISKWIDTNKPTFIAIWNEVLKVLPQVWGALQLVGSFLQSVFQPVWDQLVTTFKTQLLPAWNQFMAALGPAMPALEFIAVVIGTVLVEAAMLFFEVFGLVVRGIIFGIGGIVQGVGFLVDGFLWLLAQMTNIITGIVAIWNGIPGFFTGLWNNLKAEATVYWDAFNFIIQSKIQQGETFIHNLWTGIITWITTTWHNLVTGAEQFGTNLINNILNGLKSAWSNVTTWFQQALQWIAGLFPHSPVEHGPLVGIENWGKNMTDIMAKSIRAGMPGVQSAFGALALPGIGGATSFAGGSSSLLPGLASSATSVGGGQQMMTVQLVVDTHVLGQAIMPWAAKQIRVQTSNRSPV